MASEEKVFELMTKMYNEFSKRFESIEDRMSTMDEKITSIDKTVIRIENDHGKKLSALFDGWKQNTEQLERIEKEVSRQDEIILRKIK